MTGMTLLPMVVDTWWIHGDVVDTDAGMIIISTGDGNHAKGG